MDLRVGLICTAVALSVAVPAVAAPGQCELTYAETRPLTRIFPYDPGATVAERRALDLLFEPLVRQTSDGLMRSLMLSISDATGTPDKKTWTFPMKKQSWHSHTPVTPEQVVTTFRELKRLVSIEKREWVSELHRFDDIASMDAAMSAIRVTFTEPQTAESAARHLLNFYVIPTHDLPKLQPSYNGHIDDYLLREDLSGGVDGNGMWAPISGALNAAGEIPGLDRFDGLPGNTTPIASVASRVSVIPSERTRLFLNGDVDLLLHLPPLHEAMAKRVPGATDFDYDQNSFTSVVISTRHPALQDPKVREAMIYAIDRLAILEARYGENGGDILDAPFPPVSIAFNQRIHPRPFDKNRAVALLREAGFSGSPETGWRRGAVELDRLEFLLEESLDGAEDQEIERAIEDDLREIGITVRAFSVPPADVRTNLDSGNYDLYLTTITVGQAWDVRYELWNGSGCKPMNQHVYCSEDVKALLNQYRQVQFDELQAGEVGKRLHSAIYQSCDRIYLWSLKSKGVFNSRRVLFQKQGPYLFEAPYLWGCPD